MYLYNLRNSNFAIVAPSECLQYQTASSGTVMSFNWKDTATSANRQLVNQNYNVCFRTEVVNSQVCKNNFPCPICA